MDVVLAAFIANRDIKVPVQSKMHVRTVMVELAINHAVQDLLSIRVHSQVRGIGGEARDTIKVGRAAGRYVTDKENTIRREPRMKFHAQ